MSRAIATTTEESEGFIYRILSAEIYNHLLPHPLRGIPVFFIHAASTNLKRHRGQWPMIPSLPPIIKRSEMVRVFPWIWIVEETENSREELSSGKCEISPRRPSSPTINERRKLHNLPRVSAPVVTPSK